MPACEVEQIPFVVLHEVDARALLESGIAGCCVEAHADDVVDEVQLPRSVVARPPARSARPSPSRVSA